VPVSALSDRRRDPFLIAADIIDPPPAGTAAYTGLVAYHDRPDAFVLECFRWPEGRGPTPYQLHNLRAIPEHKRVAVRGPHGLGKTAENAWVVLWFALTRDAAGEDWKVATTASAWRQLTHFLWPEIHKWSRFLDWERIGRPPFTRHELLKLRLRLPTGEAFAAACSDPGTIEGVHADEMLYMFDEAKLIPAATFDACEGAFSGAGGDTGQNAYALAASTPGEPQGRFYEIHARKPGLEDWHAIHVTLDDTIAAKRVSQEWADQRGRQWGRGSAVFQNRVLGEFAASEEDGVIPLAWIEAANERWHELDLDDLEPLVTVGADIARSGPDSTVLALRHGLAISELRRSRKAGTMDTAGRIAGILSAHKHPALPLAAIVDVIGIGAGVVDRLEEQGFHVIAFNAAEGTTRKDSSGELGFTNVRSAAWWNLRELLDPDNKHEIALPPDDMLTGDLTAPKWRVMSGGKIQVESKDDIRKRLGRSTDDGDAVVQAYWPEGGVKASAPIFTKRPSSHRIE
jgi:hypothetical protein